jgi:uncharacterized protein (TIGR02922 family)
MSCNVIKVVTIIYYCDSALELKHQVCTFDKSESGRVLIPEDLKKDKTIVAVCNGDVEIINKLGERILPTENIA